MAARTGGRADRRCRPALGTARIGRGGTAYRSLGGFTSNVNSQLWDGSQSTVGEKMPSRLRSSTRFLRLTVIVLVGTVAVLLSGVNAAAGTQPASTMSKAPR